MLRVAGSAILSGGGVRAFPFGRAEIVTFLWIVCALGTLALSEQPNSFYTHGRYGKRDESYAQPSGFFSGSRYGRGDGGGTTNSRGSKSDVKLLEVSPRVDRFFLGSRYGKRDITDDNNNNNNNLQRVRQSRASSIMASLKRYGEDFVGYFNRLERADRIARTIDEPLDPNGSDRIVGRSVDSEKIPVKITNDDKLDNFW